ncbi:phosphomevalonate kinase, peroxisomal isoform X1 [Amborella trichopoda]|uniref:phosphomevalonate kinase, peroxisomal isoform X1 n=1 Tax=Amborella trichopoda TaxID=13333 RepID=UPI0005D40FF2|nr:phosphomevalonate kinase, peroxisomal isoform X1 [Amborella trichopoda]XP_020520514.1 phosphomevalonate kinase, peroxisomal isoform X1 [Amborella trichopoda]|eukprot:XP_011621878.1 phosphomevalonate kinase, peroxisomal isoform X1 [Amborella trichopoda]
MAVVASAPGKVLITGGYLILEKPNPGIVVSTTARFYAIVKPLYEDIKAESWSWVWTDVKLTSPQLSRVAEYKLSLKTLSLQITSSRDNANPFVEQAVQFSVAAAKALCTDDAKKDMIRRLLLQGLDITIVGSNDFYSYRNQIVAHGLPLTSEALSSLQPFSSITFNMENSNGVGSGDESKPEVAKTGLGSSAAMTTAVVATLLHYLGAINISSSTRGINEEDTIDAHLNLVHAVAQTAHCMAQGKVGSGFDVSAAVFGSQYYVRFSPEVLSPAQVMLKGSSLQDVMSDILKGKWDHERVQCSLPPLMTLVLGEPGTGGSSTPSMVGAVKRWQQSDPNKSLKIWSGLSEANSKLEILLNKLRRFAEEQWETYKMVLRGCSRHVSEKWREQMADPCRCMIVEALLGARAAMIEIRSFMQQMGKAAGVPIEPESQTQLLDTTMSLEGVLLAGVPGAGGFDAIFAVTLGESSKDCLTKVWSSLGVLPMLVTEDPRGVSLESGDPRNMEISSRINSLSLV